MALFDPLFEGFFRDLELLFHVRDRAVFDVVKLENHDTQREKPIRSCRITLASLVVTPSFNPLSTQTALATLDGLSLWTKPRNPSLVPGKLKLAAGFISTNQ